MANTSVMLMGLVVLACTSVSTNEAMPASGGAAGAAGAPPDAAVDAAEDLLDQPDAPVDAPDATTDATDATSDADAPAPWWTPVLDACDTKAGVKCCPRSDKNPLDPAQVYCTLANPQWTDRRHWALCPGVNPAGGLMPGSGEWWCDPWPGTPAQQATDWCCKP